MTAAAAAPLKPFNSSTLPTGLQQKKAFSTRLRMFFYRFPLSCVTTRKQLPLTALWSPQKKIQKLYRKWLGAQLINQSLAPRLQLLFYPKVLHLLGQTGLFLRLQLVFRLYRRVAKGLAPWGANMQPTCSQHHTSREPSSPYLITLVCSNVMDIRSHPVWHLRSRLSLWFQQYQHAKKHISCVWKKKQKQQLCLNPVKSAVWSFGSWVWSKLSLFAHSRDFFFFPCCQPHCSISVPIPSDAGCLLSHTLGPMRVCPHQTLSVFT